MYQNDLELDLSRSMTFQIEQRISEMSSTQKNNQFRGITFDYTAKNKRVSFSNMAGSGHIGFGYCGARGGVADKHLGDLLCLWTR